MRSLMFIMAFVFTSVSFGATDNTPHTITVVTVKNYNGEIVTIKSDDQKMMSKIPKIQGVAYSSSPKVCGQKGSRSQVRAFEIELELNLLAETLSEAPDRKLSESQLRRLNRIPDCLEYRPLLHAVAMVLGNEKTKYQGYEVLEQ